MTNIRYAYGQPDCKISMFFMAFLCSVVGEKNDCHSWPNHYNYFCFLIFNCLADVDERMDLIRNTRSERLDQNVMAFKGDLQFITARQDHIYGSNLAEIFTQKTTKFSQPLKFSSFISEPYNGKSGLHGGDSLQIFRSNHLGYFKSIPWLCYIP